MKKIKFRAWDKINKRMVEADELVFWNGCCYLNPDKSLHRKDKPYSQARLRGYSILEEFVMQYIGLDDKNGKEVYQGDVLKVDADKEGYGSTSYGGYVEVVSEAYGYSLRPFKPTVEELDEQWKRGGDGFDSCSLWHISDDDGKNIEVIGNVYENPELLNI